MIEHPEPELALQGGGPMYQQIETQIRDYVATGQLSPGEQLPTIRSVAVELGVNPSIVQRAYRELETEGFLTSEEGSGTFVAPLLPARLAPEECRAAFEKLCHEYLTQAARYGFSSADALALIETLTHRSVSS